MTSQNAPQSTISYLGRVKWTPENILLTRQKDFSYRLVRPHNKVKGHKMKKVILWGLVILIILCSGYIVKLSFGNPKIDILEIGTFMALTLTLIALIFYAYDTNLLASISKLKWERETVLNTTYEMVGIGDSGGAGRILFRINNPSTLIIRGQSVS